eukprot:TRINITY_DN8134_c0_g1_i2.p1 TRINITY_DN8134_c0_g1~~TRINITY_DN8134_c0_g1_i2.p1  ORF type:complete len:473 (+),score=171.45 TRINITY_DN8134_c0_g1_i2:71-1489(+)
MASGWVGTPGDERRPSTARDRDAAFQAAQQLLQREHAADPHRAAGNMEDMLRRGELDNFIRDFETRRRTLAWERLPKRIVLLRHGESEGNVDKGIYATRGDSQLELSSTGVQQAMQAGKELAELVKDEKVLVCLSPFERTQQTLLAMYHGGFPEQQVGAVHVDARIREQEFGNFQNPGLHAAVRAEENIVGRFYYRRPLAESSADVFDRVASFWNSLVSDGNDALLLGRRADYSTTLLVTHGLTIRLLLMAIFHWSVDTFESVWNLGNCEYLTLHKNVQKMRFEFAPQESKPQRIPWATREVWICFRSKQPPEELVERRRKLLELKESAEDEGPVTPSVCMRSASCFPGLDRMIDDVEASILKACSEPYLIVDFLAIPQPRTSHPQEAFRRAVPLSVLEDRCRYKTPPTPEQLLAEAAKTQIDPDEVRFVDWWGDRVSYRGKILRTSSRGHKELRDRSQSPPRRPGAVSSAL